MRLITFDPLDSLFFREAKPFNAGEGGFLDSQFPPSAQSLSGAIRTAIGEANSIDWSKPKEIEAMLGTADDPRHLEFSGPYLLKDGQPLYPVPLNLLYSKKEQKWTRLHPTQNSHPSDMGEQQFPTPKQTLEGGKPIEEGWLDANEFKKVLNGALPERHITQKALYEREARVGIGRDNRKGVVNEGLLYFTRHLRLLENVKLGMAIGGLSTEISQYVRLGGEGRLASLKEETLSPLPIPSTENNKLEGVIIILLTHGDFAGENEPNWEKLKPDLDLKLISACIGKPIREGGWDYANKRPKPLKSLVPAGSCYFVQSKSCAIEEVIKELHGKKIGQRNVFGYGEIAVGLWL